jgi:hypothetical protein
MYRPSNDPGISQANGIFGLMFGVFYMAISIYVFASIDADIGVFMVAMALLGIMYNGYKVFFSRPGAEDEFEPAKEEDLGPEVRLLMLDSLKADGYIGEEEYNAKRKAILEGSGAGQR